MKCLFIHFLVACRILVLPLGIKPMTCAMKAWILFFFRCSLFPSELYYSSQFFCFIFFLILAALSLRCCTQAFSSCSERARLLCCAGFSLWRLLLSRSTGSGVVAHRLSYSPACRVFLDGGLNSCLLHWQVDSLPLSNEGNAVDLILTNQLIKAKNNF